MLLVHAAPRGVTASVRWPWLPGVASGGSLLNEARGRMHSLLCCSLGSCQTSLCLVPCHCPCPCGGESCSPECPVEEGAAAEAGLSELDEPECVCSRAHETHRDASPLCASREKCWLWGFEVTETRNTQLHICISRYHRSVKQEL